MRALRTLASAAAILLGALLVVAWAGSWALLRAVDDGVVARTLVSAALASPAVTSRIGDEVAAQATASLDSSGVDAAALGFEAELSEIFADLAASDDFKAVVLDQVDAAQGRLHEELASEERPSGPFSVSVDVSAAVNERLDGVPVVGSQLRDVAVEPVEVELVSAETFDKARTGYSRLEFAERYFLWAGLALIALGLVVSTRRRLVIPKFLIAVGAIALGVAAVLQFASPDRIAARLPGGETGTWGSIVSESVATDSIPGMQRLLLMAGVASLLVGALLVMLVRSLRGARH